MLQGLDQSLFGEFCLLRSQKLQGQGSHQLCLAMGVQGVFALGDQLLIGFFAAFMVSAEQLDFLGGAVFFRSLGHDAQDVSGVGGGYLRVGGAEIRPMERSHIHRLRPLAVALTHVDEIFPVFPGKADVFREQGHFLAAPADHETGIPHHGGIIGFQKTFVPVDLCEFAGVEDTDVRPAHRAVHGAHVEIGAAVRGDVGQLAAFLLPIVNIPQVFPGEGGEVKEVSGGFEKDLGIACPGVPFPGGAIGGDIQVVALGRPYGGVHQGVDQGMGAAESACLGQVGVDRNGGKVFCVDLHIRFHQGIPEAEDGKGGFVVVQPLPAGVFNPLQGGGFLTHGQLDIGLGKFPGAVQHLAQEEANFLSCPGVEPEG